MKKIFLLLILVGFIIIAMTIINKMKSIDVIIFFTDEVVNNYSSKEDIDYIMNFLKTAQKEESKFDITNPQYKIKTFTTEYIVWIDSYKNIRFYDKKHPSIMYVKKEAKKMAKMIEEKKE